MIGLGILFVCLEDDKANSNFQVCRVVKCELLRDSVIDLVTRPKMGKEAGSSFLFFPMIAN
jgi:hypothetical protein